MVSGKFYMVGVFTLIGIAFICITAVTLAGRDANSVILVIGSAVPSLLALLVISKQVDAVQTKVDKVEHQTNGALAEQFADVKQHIDQVVSASE